MTALQELSQGLTKSGNQRRILNLIRQEKKTTKAELAKKLKLSIPTVTNNIMLLKDAGLVRLLETADSTGGRPPAVVEFLGDAFYSVGVDIRRESAEIILIDLNCHCLAKGSIPISLKTGMGDVIKEIGLWLEKKIFYMNMASERILGIGFSVHGIVEEEKLQIKFPFARDWFDFSRYKNALKWQAFLENEANLGAKAEWELGLASAEAYDIVFLSINQGVGTGIMIGNQLYKGSANKAGEFGHMAIYNNGRQCQCGMLGCWEAYVSVLAFEESYPIGRRSLREIFQDYESGEAAAVFHVKKYIQALALGLRNIMLILDPHSIVIGGEMSLYAHLFANELADYFQTSMKQFHSSRHILRISELKREASVWGAALLPMEKVLRLSNHFL